MTAEEKLKYIKPKAIVRMLYGDKHVLAKVLDTVSLDGWKTLSRLDVEFCLPGDVLPTRVTNVPMSVVTHVLAPLSE